MFTVGLTAPSQAQPVQLLIIPTDPIVTTPEILTQVPAILPKPPSQQNPKSPFQTPEIPSAPPQAPPVLQIPAPLPPPDQLLQPSPASTTPQTAPGVPETISVRGFDVVGSTVFSRSEFNRLLAPYIKTKISFADLFEVRSKITQLYVDRGYITSGALIPAQTLQGGIVKIQVIEGSVEAINVTGTRRLNPDYVRSRIAIGAARPLNRERLLEALQLLQLNPLIKNLKAELSAGTRPGTSVLDVDVTEAKTFNPQIGLDNDREPSVGSFRRRLELNEANLLGLGDGLSIGYSNTDGSNNLDASYTLPINAHNGTISFNYDIDFAHVVEPPFNRLNINSTSRYYELTLRQPILQNPQREFVLGLTATREESDITLLGIPYPLSPGSDSQGHTRISALRFFQEFTQRNSSQVIAARSQLTFGIGVLGATINNSPPDSRFFSWRGQAQYVRLLAADTLFLIRGDLQLSDRALVPLEQIGTGGQDTVRGYRQDIFLTDNAAVVSGEVRVPVLRLPQLSGLVQLATFIDYGTAWNSGRAAPNPNTIVSTGVGLRFQLSDRLSARLDYGIPLIYVSSPERTLQERGFYFSILATPF